MSTTTIPGPAAAVENADQANAPSANPLRRGLIGLRRLGPPSPGESLRLSPRNHFFRSAGHPQTPSPRTPRSTTTDQTVRPEESEIQTSPQLTPAGVPSGNTPEATGQGSLLNSDPTRSLAYESIGKPSAMTRHRPSVASPGLVLDAIHNGDAQRSPRIRENLGDDERDSVAAQAIDNSKDPGDQGSRPPTIGFFPHQEMRQARPSLTFSPIVRRLPTESSIIRVGRYSERECVPISNPTGPSDAPVGFKSKVVSRRHCEFSFANGCWQIKDVSSSSGTFLNHIRLSQPNTESRLYPVKDGDLVQLGIDFRGGEEMIFRCVKIRIECNRSWQRRPNHFNMNRHAQIRRLGEAGTTVDGNKGECSICLGDVAPCQSLFIAACAHVWHYKCIRRMLMGSRYPHFTCPNCRAITDLEAELETEHGQEWVEVANEADSSRDTAADATTPTTSQPSQAEDTGHTEDGVVDSNEAGDVDLTNIQFQDSLGHDPTDLHSTEQSSSERRRPSNAGSASPTTPVGAMDFAGSSTAPPLAPVIADETAGLLREASPTSADLIAGEGPSTPRNNAGPFVFGGSAGGNVDRITTTIRGDRSTT